MSERMDWHGRTVLVTGAGGFIGSHLVERLLASGADVRAMVYGNLRGSIGHLAAVSQGGWGGRFVVCGGNMRDGGFVRDVVSGVDTVFHLAAITSVKYSYQNPEETVLTNVTGALNLLNACRHEKVRRYLHTSSAGVYKSTVEGEPIRETDPVCAANPYTASKLAADSIAESFYRSYGLPVSICRPFNCYGPRVGAFLIIPTIIRQLLEGDEVWLGDLRPKRNFTYVDDMVEAFIRTAEEESTVGELVHFGSPWAVSMGELVEMIGRLMGKKPVIHCDEDRVRPDKSEILCVLADCTKARELLGWEARTPLEEGLVKTIEWMRNGGYDNDAG